MSVLMRQIQSIPSAAFWT